jgi:hypothetical protein
LAGICGAFISFKVSKMGLGHSHFSREEIDFKITVQKKRFFNEKH